MSSTDRQLQEAVDLQVALVFATPAACRAPYPPNLMFFACRFLVATKSPFSLVENGEFIKLNNLLRPGAKVADRRTMGGRLLDQAHLEEIAKVRQQLVGRNVTAGRRFLVSLFLEWQYVVMVCPT